MGVPQQILSSYGSAGHDGDNLRTDLVAWWDMEESSGNRADLHTNGHTLVDNNTVASVTGHIGTNAANFDHNNNEFLSRAVASMGDLDIGTNDLTVCFWLNIDQAQETTDTSVCNTAGDATTRPGWSVGFDGASYDDIRVKFASGTTLYSGSLPVATMSTGTWYFVIVEFDRSANISAWLNDTVSVTTVDISADVATDIIAVRDFVFGRRHSGSTARELNGSIDEAAVWKRLLTTEEKTWLYNSGTGRTYSETI